MAPGGWLRANEVSTPSLFPEGLVFRRPPDKGGHLVCCAATHEWEYRTNGKEEDTELVETERNTILASSFSCLWK